MKNARIVSMLLLLLLVPVGVSAQNGNTTEPLTFEAFEAKLKQAGRKAQILDARSEEEYAQNHLVGAIPFSVASDEEFGAKIKNLKKENPVFVYSIGNGRSGALAKKLRENGFREVTELPGGLSKWVGLGRPVASTVGEGLTLAGFRAQLQSDKLVLVDFGSRYCGACKKLAPTVDQVEKEQAARVKVIRIEAYENKALVKELGITALPTLVLYKGNKAVWQKTGVTPKTQIEAGIHESL